MADEQLRLAASIKDNATPGIRKIGREMQSIRKTPGMEQAQKWVQSFNNDVKRFTESGNKVASIMSGMGIGGLAAAGSIGALAAKFKELAEHTLNMRELGREVGLTADEINAMNRASEHFGFDPSKMEGAIQHFAGLMPEFKRGYGELNSILAKQPDLIKRLRVEDTKTQIKEIFDFLGTIKNPQDRMVFERGIFGSDEIEKLFADGAGGFEAQTAKARQSLAPITEAAAAQAQALRDAVADFNQSLSNLETRAGPTFYRWMTKAVGELDAVLGKIERHPADAGALAGVGAGAAAALMLRRKIMAGAMLGGGAGGFSRAAGELTTAGVEMKGSTATLRAAGEQLSAAATALKEAAGALGSKPGGGTGGTGAPGEPTKPGGTSPGYSNLAPAGVLALFQMFDLARNAPDQLKAAETDNAPIDPETKREADMGDAVRRFWRSLTTSKPAAAPQPGEAPAFHAPDAYNREMRARMVGDGKDHTLDGVVVGALDKPVMHLLGTLKTAAAQAETDGIKPAAFHPNGLISPGASLDPVATIAAGTKAGVLAALRELQGGLPDDASTARGGIVQASFGGGGGRSGGGGGGGNFNFAGTGSGGWEKSGASKAQVAAYIRHAFAAQGIDPSVALRIAQSEGLNQYTGDHGTSFGAFQLHYGGSGIRGMNSGGLGDRFTAETGKDARDPTTWREQIDFAAKTALREGWGAWHGRVPARVGLRDGIGTYHGSVPGADDYDHSAGGVAGKAGGINPVLNDMIKRASEIMGTQLSVYSGLRSPEHNRRVGGAEHSLHMQGLAADLQAPGHSKGDRGFWQSVNGAMAQAAKEFGQPYRWGGTFGGRYTNDNDHFDLTGAGASPEAMAKHKEMMEHQAAPLQAAGEELRAAAADQRRAAGEQGHTAGTLQTAHRVLKWFDRGSRADDPSDTPVTTMDRRDPKFAPPGWHDPNRPDLNEERRKAEDRRQQSAQLTGGIDAHVHLHDGRTSTRVERRGIVREAGITVRRAPQRVFTV